MISYMFDWSAIYGFTTNRKNEMVGGGFGSTDTKTSPVAGDLAS